MGVKELNLTEVASTHIPAYVTHDYLAVHNIMEAMHTAYPKKGKQWFPLSFLLLTLILLLIRKSFKSSGKVPSVDYIEEVDNGLDRVRSNYASLHQGIEKLAATVDIFTAWCWNWTELLMLRELPGLARCSSETTPTYTPFPCKFRQFLENFVTHFT